MLKALLFLFCLSVFAVDNAYAYIDFGTGSYVLQLLAASAIGFIFLIKHYLRRIKQFFMRNAPSDEDITGNSEEE